MPPEAVCTFRSLGKKPSLCDGEVQSSYHLQICLFGIFIILLRIVIVNLYPVRLFNS